MRTRWVAAGLAGIGVIGVGVGAWFWGQQLWWATASSWPLEPAEAEAVAACEDPGFMGLLRVLEQDLDVACPASWFAEAAERHLKPRHRLRRRWLREVALDEARTVRTRFRAGAALMLAGEGVLPDLAVLTRTTSLRPLRPDLVEAVAEERWPDGWADPDLRGDVSLWRLEDPTPETLGQAIARLRHEALASDGDPERRAWLADRALDVAGLGEGRLEDALDRRARGLGLHDLPADLERLVVNHGEACRERATAACLMFAADALEASFDEVEHGTGPTADLPRALWRVRDPRAGHADLRAEALGAVGAWVAEAPAEDRPARLVAVLVGDARPLDGAARARRADPGAVVRHHGGPPWSVALAARALAPVAGVTVVVGAEGGGEVLLDVGSVRLAVGPCGAVHRRSPESPAIRPWPDEAVLAQAALEAASAEDAATASALHVLAYRLDPVGVSAPPTADDPVVERAATLIRPPSAEPGPGARTDRASWAGRPPPACGGDGG